MPVRLRHLLASHGWLVVVAVAYLYAFPFPDIQSANELPRVYLVRSIVDDHSFAIDRQVARYRSTPDVSPSGGHLYANKAPGSSLLATPPYAIARWLGAAPSLTTTMWLARVFAGIVPALAFLWLLHRFLARFAPDPAVRRLAILAYALGSMAMTYAVLFYSHQLGAVCIASAWIVALDVADGTRGVAAMAVAGFLAGCAPLVDYQAAFGGVPIAVHVIVRLRGRPRGELVRAIGLAIGAAAVPIAVLLAYHSQCFGSPWRTGYDASETFAQYHQQGFLGLTSPHVDAFVGSLVAPDNGLFVLAPWLLLALPGFVVLWRRGERGTALVAASVAVIYVAFVSSIVFWRGGWEIGPRYITTMLPFLVPPVAAMLTELARRPLVLGAACGLVVVGIVIYVLTTTSFPYWPDCSTIANRCVPVRDPLYEITFRLLGEGAVAPNVLTAIGIGGLPSLVPYMALVGGVVATTIAAIAGRRGLLLAIGVAAWIVAALALVPHGGPHVEHAIRDVVLPAMQR